MLSIRIAYESTHNKVRPLILALLLLAGELGHAHTPVDGDIYASLGLFNYMTHARTHTFPTPLLQGPVLKAEADLNAHGGLELSLFYLQNSFSLKRDQYIVTERIKRIYIASGYRYWFDDRSSVALAFTSSYAIGEPEVFRNDYGKREHPTTSARDITEYGFELSYMYEAWRHDRFSMVIDTRYNWSVTPKRSEDANQFGALLAVKYFLQARDRSPSAPIETPDSK